MKTFQAFLVIALVLQSGLTLSQNNVLKLINETFDERTSKLYDQYSDVFGESSVIFNGPEYYHIENEVGGDPFFQDMELHDGLVIFDGDLYKDLDVGYDIFRDEVFIARSAYSGAFNRIMLSKTKVGGFEVSGQTFINAEYIKRDFALPGDGYYQLLYDGQLKVIAKRFKTIAPSDDGYYRYRFSSSARLYLGLDGIFYQVRSKSGARKLLKDQKKEIRDYTNQYQAYLLDLEAYLLFIAPYYDSLNAVQGDE